MKIDNQWLFAAFFYASLSFSSNELCFEKDGALLRAHQVMSIEGARVEFRGVGAAIEGKLKELSETHSKSNEEVRNRFIKLAQEFPGEDSEFLLSVTEYSVRRAYAPAELKAKLDSWKSDIQEVFGARQTLGFGQYDAYSFSYKDALSLLENGTSIHGLSRKQVLGDLKDLGARSSHDVAAFIQHLEMDKVQFQTAIGNIKKIQSELIIEKRQMGIVQSSTQVTPNFEQSLMIQQLMQHVPSLNTIDKVQAHLKEVLEKPDQSGVKINSFYEFVRILAERYESQIADKNMRRFFEENLRRQSLRPGAFRN